MSEQISGTLDPMNATITNLTNTIHSSSGCCKASSTAEGALDTTRIHSQSGTVSIDFGAGAITVSHPNGPILLGDLVADNGQQVIISEAGVDSGTIVTEVTARASADEALCPHIGGLPIALSEGQLADLIRQVIRKELQPGGMLHRG